MSKGKQMQEETKESGLELGTKKKTPLYSKRDWPKNFSVVDKKTKIKISFVAK